MIDDEDDDNALIDEFERVLRRHPFDNTVSPATRALAAEIISSRTRKPKAKRRNSVAVRNRRSLH